MVKRRVKRRTKRKVKRRVKRKGKTGKILKSFGGFLVRKTKEKLAKNKAKKNLRNELLKKQKRRRSISGFKEGASLSSGKSKVKSRPKGVFNKVKKSFGSGTISNKLPSKKKKCGLVDRLRGKC